MQKIKEHVWALRNFKRQKISFLIFSILLGSVERNEARICALEKDISIFDQKMHQKEKEITALTTENESLRSEQNALALQIANSMVPLLEHPMALPLSSGTVDGVGPGLVPNALPALGQLAQLEPLKFEACSLAISENSPKADDLDSSLTLDSGSEKTISEEQVPTGTTHCVGMIGVENREPQNDFSLDQLIAYLTLGG